MTHSEAVKENLPRILIVEDDAGERNFLECLLEAEYDVASAADGESAQEALASFEPQLVLLDILLGGAIDGIELCRRVKQEQQRHDIRIIVLTGADDEDVKLSALEAGANDFLRKPASPPELLTRVRNLLREADLERRLLTRNEELEDALQRLEAAQAQIVQTEKLNAVGTMAAGLLHEISNPLGTARVAVSLALRSPPAKQDEDLSGMLGDASEDLDRIGQIVRDLQTLAYPPGQAGSEAVALRPLVERALKVAWKDLGEPDVQVEISVDSDHVVAGHGGPLGYLLVNLIRNAVEVSQRSQRRGSATIWVRSEFRGEGVRLSVADNGPGVAPEHRSRVFDPFFTTKDVGKGMGLGLAFAQRIAQQHGTVVTVRNRERGGAEFAITLQRSPAS
jgi:C4-dicarboxylate-specific signal transduction histidine kinase